MIQRQSFALWSISDIPFLNNFLQRLVPQAFCLPLSFGLMMLGAGDMISNCTLLSLTLSRHAPRKSFLLRCSRYSPLNSIRRSALLFSFREVSSRLRFIERDEFFSRTRGRTMAARFGAGRCGLSLGPSDSYSESLDSEDEDTSSISASLLSRSITATSQYRHHIYSLRQ